MGYSLGLTSSVIYLGALGDRYGSKLMLVLGASLSVPACLLAAYAPSDTVLVGARALLTEYHTHDTEAAEVARRSPASHLATRLSP